MCNVKLPKPSIQVHGIRSESASKILHDSSHRLTIGARRSVVRSQLARCQIDTRSAPLVSIDFIALGR